MKTIAAITLFLAIAFVARAEEDGLEFHEAPPVVRTAQGWMPEALADVFSRLPDAERHRDPLDPTDIVTWTHEGTHGVSALGQNTHRKGDRHTIYVLDGKCITLRHPSVKLSDVAKEIGREDREGRAASMFKNYLVDQRQYWNDQPIYLIEEWVGYTNGAIVRAQAGLEQRADTVWRAETMERYCRAMAKLARKMDPEYGDRINLDRFIEWNSRRFERSQDTPWSEVNKPR